MVVILLTYTVLSGWNVAPERIDFIYFIYLFQRHGHFAYLINLFQRGGQPHVCQWGGLTKWNAHHKGAVM